MDRSTDNVDEEQYYKWTVINNNKCIDWCFPNNVKGEKRKAIKDKIGRGHLDTVMLDSKSLKGKRVYCDAIFISENISKWVNRML